MLFEELLLPAVIRAEPALYELSGAFSGPALTPRKAINLLAGVPLRRQQFVRRCFRHETVNSRRTGPTPRVVSHCVHEREV